MPFQEGRPHEPQFMLCEMGREQKRGCPSILERLRGQERARLRSQSLPDATWTGDVKDRGRTGQGTSEDPRCRACTWGRSVCQQP